MNFKKLTGKILSDKKSKIDGEETPVKRQVYKDKKILPTPEEERETKINKKISLLVKNFIQYFKKNYNDFSGELIEPDKTEKDNLFTSAPQQDNNPSDQSNQSPQYNPAPPVITHDKDDGFLRTLQKGDIEGALDKIIKEKYMLTLDTDDQLFVSGNMRKFVTAVKQKFCEIFLIKDI